MRKKSIIIISILLFLILMTTLIAQPPPPPPPPPIGDNEVSEGGSSQSTATCNDNIKNQDETDMDCGGKCPKCPVNKLCSANSDCQSNYCNPDRKCSTIACNDKFRNGNETDVDCGGNCAVCTDNSHCLANSDCRSDYCNPDKRCSIPSCSDGWKNRAETGVDCGGNCQQCTAIPTQNTQTLERQSGTNERASIQNQNQAAQQDIPKETPREVESKSGTETSVTAEEAENRGNIPLFVSIFLNFVLIGFIATILVFFYMKKSKSQSTPENRILRPTQQRAFSHYQTISRLQAPGQDLNYFRLKSFIAASLNKGFSQEEIKLKLLSGNWPEQKIIQAFNELRRW